MANASKAGRPACWTAMRNALFLPPGVRRAGRGVDLSEALLQSPGLGEHGIAAEQVTQPAAFTLGQLFGRFEQAMSGLVELWAPPNMLAAASRALRSLRAGVAPAPTADGIKRGVRATDEMEQLYTIRASAPAAQIAWR